MAVVLAVLAVSLHVFVVDPGRAAIAAARTELERESAAAQHRIVLAPPATEQQQLQLLQNLLRQSPEADELVRRMAALAQAEQIALAQGDYQQQFHSTTQVLQVHITQPVRASYPQLRRYIESVLRSIPNASLDQIAARRDNVGQTQLETRLRWSFWMQRVVSSASPAKAPPKEAMQ
jgi:hypothetical protein